jgi:hypothetical protein
MRYALFVCFDEEDEPCAAEQDRRYAAYTAYEDDLRAQGKFVSRERLRPTSASTTVRRRDGGLVVADGPFAETKEQIAGFFVVECEDLDDAIAQAAKIPAVDHGTVEVRPIWDI